MPQLFASKPYVIGVCGTSCSGKSRVCNEISQQSNLLVKDQISQQSNLLVKDQISQQSNLLVKDQISKTMTTNGELVTILSQDRYYKGGDSQTNYDTPEAIDFDYLIEQLDELCNWQPVNAPEYDFTRHCRKSTTHTISPNHIIIVEGIFVLYNEQLRKRFDLKIFVEAEPALCLARRLERDVKERGRDQHEVTERYIRDVIPSNTLYVNPTKNWSDIILMNNIKEQFIGLTILNDHIAKKIDSLKK
ncbi:MAG: phosphoribulokinase / Uridine kinase family protein [Homavirus sp.]|uniref:Phosphoribulokinase / Uridine kinase family protein n=1 Tax=Homavirus sp. TaxID=2487769 RepID=A0A3G5A4M7_9VIRU|nr:MAG: phosphoribulokinase / Uridine kinase family protein [Homavirus sp.]